MGNLFGKSKAKHFQDSQVTEHDRAVLQIKQQRDKVKQYQKRLGAQLESEKTIVKKLVLANQKSRALLLLKKKKYTEKILEKTDAELMNIETLISDIEFKNVEQSVIKGIQIGNEALKQLNAVFSIDQIESILDETQEAVEKQQQITDLISGYKEADEEDLNDELEAILGVKEVASVPAKPIEVTPEALPDVPTLEPEGPIEMEEKFKEKGDAKNKIKSTKSNDRVLVEAQ